MSDKIDLITYPDSLGKNLKELREILRDFRPYLDGVHILPFFPSDADRGFSPLTQLEVDPAFGDWSDIAALAAEWELTADLIVNHLAASSEEFRDFLAKGARSPYAEWFITAEKFSRRLFPNRRRTPAWLSLSEKAVNFLRRADKFFHRHGVNKLALRKIYRPRPGDPFVTFSCGDGRRRSLWCTFSPRQIDWDVKNPQVFARLERYMDRLAEAGVKIIRLDAIGYVIKKRGRSGFMIGETYRFIRRLAEAAASRNLRVLPEVHAPWQTQSRLAALPEVDYVYDFQLPLLVLYALLRRDARPLRRWIEI
ncbi:MAG TPA: hypothetical protein ENJ77_00260, partial [Candidatus Moranbacteria bacterium]|nr:hypothetical protein [Candidatus Moranbacteria bacterium]